MTPTPIAPPAPALTTGASPLPLGSPGGPFDLAGAVLRWWGSDAAAGGWGHAAVALALWLVLGLIAALVLRCWQWLGRRTASEIDDILVDQLRRPLWALLGSLAAADVADGLWRAPTWVAWLVVQATHLAVVASAAWWLSAAVEHGLVRGLEAIAGRSHSRFDDQLTPLVRLISRPLVWVLAAIVALDLVGVNVRSLALIVGGTSFVLAFALKESLEDIFSGIMLFVDQPFQPNDVLQLQDGTICEVQRTALRTTHLYDASAHSIVIVPNRTLAAQKVTNLSRPSPDLKLVVRVDVAEGADHNSVVERLKAAAEGHPWVVGDGEAKRRAMRARIDRLVWHGQAHEALALLREFPRVAAESEARRAVGQLSRVLLRLSSSSHSWEREGFSAGERRRVDDGLAEVEHLLASVHAAVAEWLLCVRFGYVVGNPMGLAGDAVARLRAASAELRQGRSAARAEDLEPLTRLVDEHLAPAFGFIERYRAFVGEQVRDALRNDYGAALILLPRDLVDARQAYYLAEGQERLFARTEFGAGMVDGDSADGGIPDLDGVIEYLRRYVEWSQKSAELTERMGAVRREATASSGHRLDEMLLGLHRWLAFDFMEVGPTWKYPSVALASFDNGRQYDLKCYVDDVRLAHYTRASKVAEHVRLDVLRLFDGLEPRIAFGGPVITVGHGDTAAERAAR